MEGTKLAVLTVEPPQREGISARKLVLETAYHNVLSAYSSAEGLELLRRFPAVDAVVIHSDMQDMACEDLAKEVHSTAPKVPVILLTPQEARSCRGAQYQVNSHDPQALLALLENQFGAAAKAKSPGGNARPGLPRVPRHVPEDV